MWAKIMLFCPIEQHTFTFFLVNFQLALSTIFVQRIQFGLDLVTFRWEYLSCPALILGRTNNCRSWIFFPASSGFLFLLVCVSDTPICISDGFGPAPLNKTTKNRSPSMVPCPDPEFRGIFLDILSCQRICNVRPLR